MIDRKTGGKKMSKSSD